MKTASCFGPAHILLPGENIPLEKWGCVACDQFTSDRAYWEQAHAAVGGCPSTLRLILPEVYLEDEDAARRVENIHAAMDEYSRDVLTRAVDGFVYVERTEQSGRVRQGLVGKIDLEAYSYEKGAQPAIRPSERTVTERIPPRMAVRRGAALETPHVMMLADDPGCTLVEPIGAHKSELKKLYEGELMQGGGHIAGWAVEDPAMLAQIESTLTGVDLSESLDRCEPLAWGDNGASVWRLDDTLGERLAACDEETLARCAEELAVCEAFESESWAEEEILSLLFALRELAESAEDEASTFFVWLCAC